LVWSCNDGQSDPRRHDAGRSRAHREVVGVNSRTCTPHELHRTLQCMIAHKYSLAGITKGLLPAATKVKCAGGLIPSAVVARRTVTISLASGEICLGVILALTYRVACARTFRKPK